MEFHEAANIFPLDEEHIDDLAKDIKRHGLIDPIETYQGKILDGRRRWLACKKAKVEPELCDVTWHVKDVVDYVISKNKERRHLTPSQMSMVGTKANALREKLRQEALERKAEGGKAAGRGRRKKDVETLPHPIEGKTRDQLGKTFGVSGRMMDYAQKVRDKGEPELVEAVEQGRMSVKTAAVLATEPPEVQREVVQSGRHNRKYKPVKNVRARKNRPALEIIDMLKADIDRLIPLVEAVDKGTTDQRKDAVINLRLAKKYIATSSRFFK